MEKYDTKFYYNVGDLLVDLEDKEIVLVLQERQRKGVSHFKTELFFYSFRTKKINRWLWAVGDYELLATASRSKFK